MTYVQCAVYECKYRGVDGYCTKTNIFIDWDFTQDRKPACDDYEKEADHED